MESNERWTPTTHQPPQRRIPLIRRILLCRLIDLERRLAILVHLHDTRRIATAIAVIGRGPDGDEGIVKHVFEAFLDELVGAGDEGEGVDVVELGFSNMQIM